MASRARSYRQVSRLQWRGAFTSISELTAGLRFYKIPFYKIKNPNTRISTHIHYYIHTIVLYRVVFCLVETNLVETKACRVDAQLVMLQADEESLDSRRHVIYFRSQYIHIHTYICIYVFVSIYLHSRAHCVKKICLFLM